MIDLTTFTVSMDDNRDKTITIDPVFIGLPARSQAVYRRVPDFGNWYDRERVG
ncbi:hypothetical protein SAMN05192574_102279 [Mucilaginibacter gossypiicola]|uniref:Uncharacterized protein n=1 Tax=Mucilaginibacter gossypiicola TaxID=551995 RepID=A0A1H8DAW4_9SPHI|nr:hypothetical protein [Mucilaginibacter gossypiicola]SEN04410.1 hypothetical protein SAMN05192574_102279 [Mucilaginibacter gossypiicola]